MEIERTHPWIFLNWTASSAIRQFCESSAFIFCAALALRLFALCVIWRRDSMGAAGHYGYEVGSIAVAIVNGRGFSSPSPLVETGPTAWLCPIYPFLAAGVFEIWGTFTITSHLVLQALNCIFSALVILPMRACAERSFSRQTAIGSCWLWVILPFAWWIPVQYVWDTTLSALAFATLFWVTLAIRGRPILALWIAYGALWAAGALVSAAMLALFPFFLAWLVYQPRQFPFSLRFPAAALLACVLLLLPWTFRNHHVLGKWIPLRSNFGLELWLGNNPGDAAVNSFAQHPTWNHSEAAEFQRVGEINYTAAKQRAALAYIRAHPAETARAIAARVWSNWFAVTDRVNAQWSSSPAYVKALFLANFFMVLFAAFGLIVAPREIGGAEALPYWIAILIFPLPYYLTHTLVRYRFPIEPMLTILAAYGLLQLWSWLTGRALHAPDRSAVS